MLIKCISVLEFWKLPTVFPISRHNIYFCRFHCMKNSWNVLKINAPSYLSQHAQVPFVTFHCYNLGNLSPSFTILFFFVQHNLVLKNENNTYLLTNLVRVQHLIWVVIINISVNFGILLTVYFFLHECIGMLNKNDFCYECDKTVNIFCSDIFCACDVVVCVYSFMF